jgi:thiol-disulfide isomerase/thioredoxin
MISLLTPVIGLFLFQVGSQPAKMPTQTNPDQILSKVNKVLADAMSKVKRPRTRAEYNVFMAAMNKARSAQKKVAAAALKKNKDLLSKGTGLRVRGDLQVIMGEYKDAIGSWKSFVAGIKDKKTPKAQEALVKLAFYTFRFGEKKEEAKKFIEQIDESLVPAPMARMFQNTKKGFSDYMKLAAMHGKKAIPIVAQKILNPDRQEGDPASFSLDSYRGKVVILDFWATWCPPCRGVIPSLIEMQKEKGNKDLAVIGVTRFYTSGMDFSDPKSKIPHGGKTVRNLSADDEVEVNKAFMKRFGVNYPIVFSKNAGKDYMVRGIPTLFVIGRDGKVIGHVVGGGDANHKKVEAWVEKALKAKKATD